MQSHDLMNEWARQYNNHRNYCCMGREIDASQKLGLADKTRYTLFLGLSLPKNMGEYSQKT